MKAIVYTEYGPPDVLQIKEMETPVPADDEILVRVRAVSVGFGDVLARNFRAISPMRFSMPLFFWLPARLMFGFFKPRNGVLGSEYSGTVAATGERVRRFNEGDAVFGYRGPAMGANAEYIRVREGGLVAFKPSNVSFEEAAVIPYGALTALNLLSHVNITNGSRVLIVGASGSIGSAAVQLCKHFGAEVTGVCGTRGVKTVKALGADKVIDYKKQDFTGDSQTYDLIFDVLGRSSFGACRRLLERGGTYFPVSFKTKDLLQMLWTRVLDGRRVTCALSAETRDDLDFIRGLVEAGRIKAVVDKTFSLKQAAKAHAHAECGARKGGVVVTLDDDA